VEGSSRPSYRLFDPIAVAIATAFGSPLVGAGLMALNYRRVGRSERALTALAIGVLTTGLIIMCGYVVPSYATLAVGISAVVAANQAAKAVQGAMLQKHLQLGGKLASRWTALGLGAAFTAIVYGAIATIILLADSKVVIGSNDRVHYAGAVAQQDAIELGAALRAMGFLQDRGIDVFLSKDQDGTTVSFVVQEGAWSRPEIAAEFEKIGLRIAPRVGGFPMAVQLMNDRQEPMKKLTIGRVVSGAKDEIYYLGSSTEAQAQALAASLRAQGFLTDRGASVLLSKDDGVTSIAFAVAEGSWEDESVQNYFGTLTRNVAAAVGGAPVTLQLLGPDLQLKKALLIT
jgi:hypothetical protein